MLLVANERTRAALPRGVCSNVVDAGGERSRPRAVEHAAHSAERSRDSAARFVFMGRLVDWKAVDLLLLAFKQHLPKPQ